MSILNNLPDLPLDEGEMNEIVEEQSISTLDDKITTDKDTPTDITVNDNANVVANEDTISHVSKEVTNSSTDTITDNELLSEDNRFDTDTDLTLEYSVFTKGKMAEYMAKEAENAAHSAAINKRTDEELEAEMDKDLLLRLKKGAVRKEAIKDIGEELLDISKRTGVSVGQLAKAAYTLVTGKPTDKHQSKESD